jgi:hypothetical protein
MVKVFVESSYCSDGLGMPLNLTVCGEESIEVGISYLKQFALSDKANHSYKRFGLVGVDVAAGADSKMGWQDLRNAFFLSCDLTGPFGGLQGCGGRRKGRCSQKVAWEHLLELL